MKATAVLIYEQFCNFEISVLLEILAMAEKPVVIFAKNKNAVKSEEGITILPDKSIDELELEEYDSLALPGAMDIRDAIESQEILQFIRKFDTEDRIIGAISIAPILLVKAGIMGEKPFMAGINKEELYEEGYTDEDLKNMVGWDDNLAHPIKEGYIVSEHIITSVSYEFIRWAIKFAELMGIKMSAKAFGIRDSQE